MMWCGVVNDGVVWQVKLVNKHRLEKYTAAVKQHAERVRE